ncbi:hypothetical protein ACLOJK_035076 [Asimina triloba]
MIAIIASFLWALADGGVWGALLELAFQRVVELEPTNVGCYALMSNKYSDTHNGVSNADWKDSYYPLLASPIYARGQQRTPDLADGVGEIGSVKKKGNFNLPSLVGFSSGKQGNHQGVFRLTRRRSSVGVPAEEQKRLRLAGSGEEVKQRRQQAVANSCRFSITGAEIRCGDRKVSVGIRQGVVWSEQIDGEVDGQ